MNSRDETPGMSTYWRTVLVLSLLANLFAIVAMLRMGGVI
jgi:hypothetical protein